MPAFAGKCVARTAIPETLLCDGRRMVPSMLDRRQAIQVLTFGAGGLLAGVCWPRTKSVAAESATARELPGAFVLVRPDNEVVIRVNKPEMGQGTMTSIPMLIADELDVAWNRVHVEWAPVRAPFTDPGFYGVEWSSSVRDLYLPMRRLGAGLRELLVAAAARRWSISAQECRTANGTVVHRDGGRSYTYAELAGDLVGATLNPEPRLRAKPQLIGRGITSVLAPDIVTGKLQFGLDARVPDAVTAVLVRPPNANSRLASVDDAAARRISGVIAIEKVAQGVAVIAKDFWTAQRARSALHITWLLDGAAELSSEGISRRLRVALDEPPTFVPFEHLPPDLEGTRIEAVYEVPFQAHAAIEPTSAIAEVGDGKCTVWMATQNIAHVQGSVGAALGIDRSAIDVRPQTMGGSFGRKYHPEPAIEAALLAQRLRRPVRVIWTREDEIHNGPHRPAQVGRLCAVLGPDKLPRSLEVHWAGPSYFIKTPQDVERIRARRGGFDGSTLEGMVPFTYPVPFMKAAQHWMDFGIAVGSWRSTAHSFNTFFSESFVDELATRTGEDPCALRLRWLRAGAALDARRLPQEAYQPPFDRRRLERVIERVAELSSWGKTLPKGQGNGLAIQFAYQGYEAAVARVVVHQKEFVVARVWLVADVGAVVNRSAAEQQLYGGFIFGLTAAIKSGLTVRGGAIEQSNFHDFAILRGNEVPQIDIELIASNEAPGGLGEAGVPLAAPAVANAVFAATGERLRTLPLKMS
jgi:isoquinoline 1-oxidoreductase beta subunit